jgi:hypothetical protein
MSDQGETLPPAGTEDQEDLIGWSIDELDKELEKYFHIEYRQPGDMDAHDLAARFNVEYGMARDRMVKIARQNPYYQQVWVFDPGTNKYKWVLRKKVDEVGSE